ncbi:tetratricopeptide repeat protein [Kitasatospora sp. LaBMicrA B282]|uniref:tetratricopeptide repeat protein n=1 Tax=Kitasatospora sp. LaBMicrA B282 TaxID=3420949 RepID=UPI003D0A3250
MRINQQDTQQDRQGRVLHGGAPYSGEVASTDPDSHRLITLVGYREGWPVHRRRWAGSGELVEDAQLPLPQADPADTESARAAEGAFAQGAQERNDGNTDAARTLFQRAADSGHPDVGPKALANLAVLEAAAGRTEQARTVFERAIATGHPDHAPQSLFNYAVFRQREGDPAHARELYQQAIATGHLEHARKALFNLGNLAAAEGRTDEAGDLFLRAMAPPFRGETAYRAHRRLREVDPGRLAEAREVYLRAIGSEERWTATMAHELLYDLDPEHHVPPPTIEIGRRTFALAEVEAVEWAGVVPRYGSGHVDVHTRDGEQHTVHLDLGDSEDRRGYDWLQRLNLGPDRR